MRDQLYAALRWPLYNPRRLLLVVAGLVLLLVLVSVAGGQNEPPQATGAAPRPPAASPSPTANDTTAAPPDLNAALDTGRNFVAAWASHESKKQWLARVQPFATEKFAQKLASVDPSRVAATEAGPAKNTDTGADSLTSVAVETDAGVVSVKLMWSSDRWWVYDLQPGAQAEA